MPQYQRGMEDVLKYLASNLHYPDNQEDFQGSIKIEFIVTKKGDLENIRIPNKAELTEVDKEAVKVFSTMPRWKPGKCNGITVPVKMLIPVKL